MEGDRKWNIPVCVGAINGKYINIITPYDVDLRLYVFWQTQ